MNEHKRLKETLDKAVAEREVALIERAELQADLNDVQWRTGSTRLSNSEARQAYDRAREAYLKAALRKSEARVAEANSVVRAAMVDLENFEEILLVEQNERAATGRPREAVRMVEEDDALTEFVLDKMLGGL